MRTALVVTGVVIAALAAASGVRAEPLTKVYINGVPTPVYFNDGDSFRPQAGPLKGQQSRLAGYNTLESYGGVHSWGTWNPHELYVNAKLATLEARRGVWHCDTDGKKDGYGRLLLFCKDLARDLIVKGLAHAYSVKGPGDADLMAAQREAMENRRGMWAHGVPHYVMTSIHSASEGGGKDGKTYNRLISTFDAHTKKWLHTDNYTECQTICEKEPQPTPADQTQNLETLRADAAAAPALEGLPDDVARAVVRDVVDLVDRSPEATAADYFIFEATRPAALTKDKVQALLDAARRAQGDQKLAVSGTDVDSCFVYVDFRRRYGGDRAACLR